LLLGPKDIERAGEFPQSERKMEGDGRFAAWFVVVVNNSRELAGLGCRRREEESASDGKFQEKAG
jgi:hypothetical protein